MSCRDFKSKFYFAEEKLWIVQLWTKHISIFIYSLVWQVSIIRWRKKFWNIDSKCLKSNNCVFRAGDQERKRKDPHLGLAKHPPDTKINCMRQIRIEHWISSRNTILLCCPNPLEPLQVNIIEWFSWSCILSRVILEYKHF